MTEEAAVAERRTGAYIATGLVGGILSGLLGIGGGVVLVPLMVTVLHIRQHLAHGTSLAIVTLTALVAGISYAQQGFLPPEAWLLAGELAVGTVAGVNVGARIMNRLPARRLRQVFGVFMVLVGLRMAAIAVTAGESAPLDWQGDALVLRLAAVLLIGITVGIFSGLLGVGGGVFIIPVLVVLLGVPQHVAQGVSLAVVVPTAVFGSYAHHRRGNVNFSIAFWIGLGSAIAAVVGAQLAAAFEPELLGRLFGLLLIATGIRMLWTK